MMPFFEFYNGYPVVKIVVEFDGKSSSVKAIIDTGSPYTILPALAFEKFKLTSRDVREWVVLHGVIRKKVAEVTVPAYLVNLRIVKKVLKDFLVIKYDFLPKIGLLGHNVLKEFQLTVNWKKKLVKLE